MNFAVADSLKTHISSSKSFSTDLGLDKQMLQVVIKSCMTSKKNGNWPPISWMHSGDRLNVPCNALQLV